MTAAMKSMSNTFCGASASSCARFVVDIMDTVILAVSIILLRIRLCERK